MEVLAARAGRGVDGVAFAERHHEACQRPGVDAVGEVALRGARDNRSSRAALPLLRRSSNPTVVNVSSILGSFWAVTNPDRPEYHVPLPLHAASKSAATMLTVPYAKAHPGIRFNALEPGTTATGMTAAFGIGRPVAESATTVVRLATLGLSAGSTSYYYRTRIALLEAGLGRVLSYDVGRMAELPPIVGDRAAMVEAVAQIVRFLTGPGRAQLVARLEQPLGEDLEYRGAPVPKKMNRLGALAPTVRGFFLPIEKPAPTRSAVQRPEREQTGLEQTWPDRTDSERPRAEVGAE